MIVTTKVMLYPTKNENFTGKALW